MPNILNAYRGQLVIDSATDKFIFHTEDGHDINITIPDNVPFPDFGKTVEALIDSNGDLIDWQYDLSDLPSYQVRPLHIAVGYGVSKEEDLNDPVRLKALEGWAKDLENEARKIGRDRWDVHTYLGMFVGVADSIYQVKWRDLENACREANPDAPSFTHLCAIMASGPFGGVCGQAFLGGRDSFSKVRCMPKRTHIHETLGHSIMGLTHSGWGRSEYGESDTYMGDSSNRDLSDFNTPHLVEAGLVESNNIRVLPKGKSVSTWLVQGSDDPLSMKLGENKAVLCLVDGQDARVMVSFYKESVRVHVPGFKGSERWVKTQLEALLRQGDEAVVAGVRVKAAKVDSDRALVKVWNHSQTAPAEPVEPVWVIPSEDSRSPAIGDWCRGQWGNRKWSVQGIHVGLTVTNKLVLHWLTWDRYRSGAHRWYWSVCDIAGNGKSASGQLLTADESGKVSEVGELVAFWHSHESGIVRVRFDSGLRCAVPLQRVFAASPHPMAGYYGVGNREGLTLSVNSNGHALAYWLRHNDAGEQVWHMLIGPLDSMKVYAVDGGQLCVNSDFSIQEIGTARIEDRRFIYDIGEVGDREMRRLA